MKIWTRLGQALRSYTIRALTPDQLVNLLPSMRMFAMIPRTAAEESTLHLMSTATLRFAELPPQVQRQALIRGLERGEPHVRETCAERLCFWQNSPEATRAMLGLVRDPERSLRRSAAMHLSSVASFYNLEDVDSARRVLELAVREEPDEQVRGLLAAAIERLSG